MFSHSRVQTPQHAFFLFSRMLTHSASAYTRRFSTVAPVLLDSISGLQKEINQHGNYYSWYSCGPTVYDSSHVGHARTYVEIDLLQRILNTQFGINIYSAMGITTIDDKILRKSKETNIAWKDIARKFESEFFDDMRHLNVMKPMSVIRVDENIPAICDFIKVLIDKDIAYVTPSGVYFDTQSPHYSYSKLVPSVLDEDMQSRLAPDIAKRHPHDFALWKNYPETTIGGMQTTWSSPWGSGLPGWHVECSTNCQVLFGSKLNVRVTESC